MEYGRLAERLGKCPAIFRVPTQNSDPDFIAALAGLPYAAPGSAALAFAVTLARVCARSTSQGMHPIRSDRLGISGA